MNLFETLDLPGMFADVAHQFFVGDITLNGRTVHVAKTPSKGLRIAQFNGLKAIEQNPDTSSEWASEARMGKQVIQFLDKDGRYLGNTVDGKVTIYPRRSDG